MEPGKDHLGEGIRSPGQHHVDVAVANASAAHAMALDAAAQAGESETPGPSRPNLDARGEDQGLFDSSSGFSIIWAKVRSSAQR